MSSSLTSHAAVPDSFPAAKVATTIETMAEDLRTPIIVQFRAPAGASDVTTMSVGSLIPDAHFLAAGDAAGTALAIADQVEAWSRQFAALANAVRQRFNGL